MNLRRLLDRIRAILGISQAKSTQRHTSASTPTEPTSVPGELTEAKPFDPSSSEPDQTRVEGSDKTSPQTSPSKSTSRTETPTIIGFDFGTSCSKVVIRTPLVGGGRAVAVPAASIIPRLSGYLIPSGIDITEQGSVRIGSRLGDGRSPARSLKLNLYENPGDLDAQSRAVAFIAVVLAGVRTWFMSNKRENLGPNEPKWQFNLGIPTARSAKSPQTDSFLAVAKAGWHLSFHSENLTLEMCRNALVAQVDPPADLDTIPEVVAEMVGYAHSTRREEGLHVLFDVGAFTTDVCGFILFRRAGEMNYSLLTTNVKACGTHQLHEFLIESIGRDRCLPEAAERDPFNPFESFPGGVQGYCRSTEPKWDDYVQHEKREFRDPSAGQIIECIRTMKRDKGGVSSKWQSGLPVFFCGGGSKTEWYSKLLSHASSQCEKSFNIAPFNIMTLPRPEQLVNSDLSEDMFQRMAVAYGLSFDRMEFGEIRYPDEIPNLERPKVRQPVAPVSKDQV